MYIQKVRKITLELYQFFNSWFPSSHTLPRSVPGFGAGVRDRADGTGYFRDPML